MSTIVLGPFARGLETSVQQFYINNDAFPELRNAYNWRGRVKRKRGTRFLARLTRFFDSTSTAYSQTSTINLSGGAANLLTGFSLQTEGSLVPGTIEINDTTAVETYTDDSAGNLTGSLGGSGTVNYASGAITISGGATNTINANFVYYPQLPVLGLEDFDAQSSAYPKTIAFDTTYAYEILTTTPHTVHSVSFYKNNATGTPTGYTQKTTWTPTTWNGQNYQQFWSVNYQDALFVTNGVTVPFSPTNVGMHYQSITNISAITAGPPGIATFTIGSHPLVVGDYVFINETDSGVITGVNFQTGFVTAVAATTITVRFPNATLGGAGGATNTGIVQFLTNRTSSTVDCLRWYDGDPTNANPTNPTFSAGNGWVNFCPPISRGATTIGPLRSAQYYLIGCKVMTTFKDRLLFFGPVLADSAGNVNYLEDTLVYSEVGTPFYTASFTGDVSLATTVFNPLLVPSNQVATPGSFFSDQVGFGGFISFGLNQPINSVAYSEDVLIVGFENLQGRLIYRGNDLLPFELYLINTEYGTSSTHSVIEIDDGVYSRGNNGIIAAAQTQVARIDTQIIDQVFQFYLQNNGAERVTAGRDFINEWIYLSYVSNDNSNAEFNNKTLYFNYRDNSWAVFEEAHTHYGQFRESTGKTWSTLPFSSWAAWQEPWNSGTSTLLQPYMIAGTQQGFVQRVGYGTSEQKSLAIRSFSGSTIESPGHSLQDGNYIYIEDCLGTISTEVNNKIFSINVIDEDTFTLNPTIATGTYLGNGVITRLYQPFIQTKQFPVAWQMARKTRIGTQRYLLSTTASGQCTLLIYLNQNDSSPYNETPIVPDPTSTNLGLIFSTILWTAPESTNLGLTPANVNLLMPSGSQSNQLWHRVSTSMIGDTVQFAISLSDTQMRQLRDSFPGYAYDEIELHGAIIDVKPSQMLV
jgi:hypothetical protein